MMTTAGNKTYELKAIDKRNGTVTGSIPLGQDKEPRYEVDGFTNTVYLAEGGAVKAYKL